MVSLIDLLPVKINWKKNQKIQRPAPMNFNRPNLELANVQPGKQPANGICTVTLINNLRSSYMGNIIQTLILAILPETRLAKLTPIIGLLPTRYFYGLGQSACYFVTGIFSRVAALHSYNIATDQIAPSRSDMVIRAIGQATKTVNEVVQETVEPLKVTITSDIHGFVEEAAADLALSQASHLGETAASVVHGGIAVIGGASALQAMEQIHKIENTPDGAAEHFKEYFLGNGQSALLFMVVLLGVSTLSFFCYYTYKIYTTNNELIGIKQDRLLLLELLEEERKNNLKELNDKYPKEELKEELNDLDSEL